MQAPSNYNRNNENVSITNIRPVTVSSTKAAAIEIKGTYQGRSITVVVTDLGKTKSSDLIKQIMKNGISFTEFKGTGISKANLPGAQTASYKGTIGEKVVTLKLYSQDHTSISTLQGKELKMVKTAHTTSHLSLKSILGTLNKGFESFQRGIFGDLNTRTRPVPSHGGQSVKGKERKLADSNSSVQTVSDSSRSDKTPPPSAREGSSNQAALKEGGITWQEALAEGMSKPSSAASLHASYKEENTAPKKVRSGVEELTELIKHEVDKNETKDLVVKTKDQLEACAKWVKKIPMELLDDPQVKEDLNDIKKMVSPLLKNHPELGNVLEALTDAIDDKITELPEPPKQSETSVPPKAKESVLPSGNKEEFRAQLDKMKAQEFPGAARPVIEPINSATVAGPSGSAEVKTFEQASQNIETLKNKFIGVTVANKNLSNEDPRRKEFLSTNVQGALADANKALSDLNGLKKQVENDPEKMKQLQYLEKGLNQMVSVLKSIQGEPRISTLNDHQKEALALLQVDNKIRTEAQLMRLNTLLNGKKDELKEMDENQLRGLVDEQAMICLESYENPSFNPQALGAKLLGTLADSHPSKKITPEQWVNSSPAASMINQERKVYQNSYQVLVNNVKTQTEGYEKAKNDTVLLYGTILDVVAPGVTIDECLKAKENDLMIAKSKIESGEMKGDLNNIQIQHDVLVSLRGFIQASGIHGPKEFLKLLMQDQKNIVLNPETGVSNLGTAINSISVMLSERSKDASDAQKIKMRDTIGGVDKLPKFKLYQFDNILLHIKMPTATDTVNEYLKQMLRAKEKLAQGDPKNIGLQP